MKPESLDREPKRYPVRWVLEGWAVCIAVGVVSWLLVHAVFEYALRSIAGR